MRCYFGRWVPLGGVEFNAGSMLLELSSRSGAWVELFRNYCKLDRCYSETQIGGHWVRFFIPATNLHLLLHSSIFYIFWCRRVIQSHWSVNCQKIRSVTYNIRALMQESSSWLVLHKCQRLHYVQNAQFDKVWHEAGEYLLLTSMYLKPHFINRLFKIIQLLLEGNVVLMLACSPTAGFNELVKTWKAIRMRTVELRAPCQMNYLSPNNTLMFQLPDVTLYLQEEYQYGSDVYKEYPLFSCTVFP